MGKKTTVFIAVVIVILLTVPLALGATSSAKTGENGVIFNEVSNGGVSASGKTIKQDNQHGHVAFRIQNDQVTSNVITATGKKTFTIVLPAEVSICIMVETASPSGGTSWLNMTMGGTGYTASAPHNVSYFSTEHRNGNVLLPVTNFDDVVFMKLDQEIVVDCEGYRLGARCPLKIYIIFE